MKKQKRNPMQTLKSTILTLLAVGILTACNDDSLEIDRPPNDQYFSATITVNETYRAKNKNSDEIVLKYSGEGMSNLMGAIQLEMTHVRGPGKGKGSFNIRNGQFTIFNDTGEEISGTYSGEGFLKDGFLQVIQNWNITQGAERFQDSQGTLDVTLDNSEGYQSSTFSGAIGGGIIRNVEK